MKGREQERAKKKVKKRVKRNARKEGGGRECQKGKGRQGEREWPGGGGPLMIYLYVFV